MKKLIFLFLIPIACYSQEFNFQQERSTIPVEFDGVECQVPWTTGYSYIQPAFCDIDGDNDYDLFFGSDWARLTYLRNEGNNSIPSFTFESDSFVTLENVEPQSQRPNHPVFCDIDDDGDFDLIVGTYYSNPISEGRIFFYRNDGNNQNPSFTFIEDTFQGIIPPSNSHPHFIDIDNDNDFDLFLGFSSPWTAYAGEMSFYRNQGTPDSALMILEIEQFMGIDLGVDCIPAFCDIDDDGDYDMFLGEYYGQIHFYRNDGTPEIYNFTEVPGYYQNIDVGYLASPEFCDIDYDGDFDLFVGSRSWGDDNTHGDIWFYENTGTPDLAVFALITQNFITNDIGSLSAPTYADINNDGLIDLFFGDIDGNLNHFSNVGTETAPSFSLVSETFQNVQAAFQCRPCFGDIDDDGDLDLLAGRSSWTSDCVMFYLNEGTPEIPNLVEHPEYAIETGHDWTSPELIDIDNDGDLDLFVGHYDNEVMFYENVGSPDTFRFHLMNDNYLNNIPSAYGDLTSICFGDLDSDGDYDIIRGHSDDDVTFTNSYLDFYRNVGDPENPNYVLEEEHFLGITLVAVAEPFLTDIDNDTDLDLFIGDFCGGVTFWRNNAVSGIADNPEGKQPYTFALHQNYPNPFNPSTTIRFDLPVAGAVSLAIYDIQGREIIHLIDDFYQAGYHTTKFDGRSLASGIYFARLKAGNYSQTRKMLLVK